MPIRKAPDQLSSHQFMQGVPAAVRGKLPLRLRDFDWRARGYLVQLYYGDPDVHYEVWSIRRIGRLEIGLHFESRDLARNEWLRERFDEHILDIVAQWGPLQLERWDRGWARLYQSRLLLPFTLQVLQEVSTRLAELIRVTRPIYQRILRQESRLSSPGAARRPKRSSSVGDDHPRRDRSQRR